MYILRLYKESFSGVDRAVWLLSVVTFINRAGAMVLPFLSLYLSTVEGYSLSTTGGILLFYGIGSFFGNYIGGVLSDKIGAFRLQFLSLLTTAVAFLFLPYLHNPISMSIGLFVTSLLADTFRPANMASIGMLSNPENRTKAVGVIRLAINIGFAAGPAFGGIIAHSLGYHYLFVIDSSTCLLASLFLLYFFRKYLKEEGKTKPKSKEEKSTIINVLKDKQYITFLLFILLMVIVFLQFFNAVPVFLKQNLLFSEDQIGLLMALNGLLIVILELPLIQWLEKRNILHLITLGTLVLASSYIVLIYENWSGISIVCVLLFTIGEILTLPFAVSLIISRADESLRGRYLALFGMTISICHMLAPVLGLKIADYWSFSVLWIMGGILLALSALGFWSLRHRLKP